MPGPALHSNLHPVISMLSVYVCSGTQISTMELFTDFALSLGLYLPLMDMLMLGENFAEQGHKNIHSEISYQSV